MDIEQTSRGGTSERRTENSRSGAFQQCYSQEWFLHARWYHEWCITKLRRNMKIADLVMRHISKKESEHLTTMMFCCCLPVVLLSSVLRHSATAARTYLVIRSVINMLTIDEGVPLNQSKLKDKSDGILPTEKVVMTLDTNRCRLFIGHVLSSRCSGEMS
jgi:hypothetical protein